MPTVAKLVAEIEADISGLKKGVDDAQRKLDELADKTAATGRRGQQSLAEWGSSAISLGSKFKSVGQSMTIGLSLPIVGLGKKALDSALKMDSLERGLTAMMGSAAAAQKELVRLREVAKVPGLGFAEAVQGSLRLQSVKVSADQSARAMKAFGNALAIVGGGKDKLDLITYQLGQMFGAGKLQGDEIRSITDAVPQLRQVLLDTFGTMDTKILNKKYNINQIFEGMLKGLEKLPKMVDSPKNQLENIGDSIFLSLVKIGKAIIPLVISISNQLVPAIESLADKFAKLPPGTQQTIIVIAALVAGLGPLTVVLGSVISAAGTVATAIAAIGWPITLVIAAVAALALAWTTNFGGIRDKTMPIIKELVEGFNFIKDIVVEVFQKVWPSVVDTWNTVMKAMQPVFKAVGDWFNETFGYIKDWVVENWPLIQKTIKTVMDVVVAVVKSALESIKKFWERYGENIVGVIKGLWAVVSNVISAAIKLILGIVKVGMQVLQGDWSGAWETIKKTASEVWQHIVKALKGLWEAVVNIFKGIVKFVYDLGKSFWDAAVNIAKSIVEGIVNGIKNMASKVWEAVKGLAQGALDIMKGMLGIHSPSREFKAIGEDLVKGYVLGITSMMAPANSAITELAKQTIATAKAEMKEYEEVMKTLKGAYMDETVAIKMAMAVTDEERVSLELLRKSYMDLNAEQRKMIDNIIDMRKVREDLLSPAEDIGISDEGPAYNPLQGINDFVTSSASLLTQAITKYQDIQNKINGDLTKELKDANIELLKAKGLWTRHDEIVSSLGIKYEDLTKSQQAMVDAIVASNEELEKFNQQQRELEMYKQKIEDLATGISDVLVGAFDKAKEEGFDTFFTNVIDGFQQMLYRMAMEYLQSQLVKLLMRSLDSLFGGSGGLDGFATGGRVKAGAVSVVGERGPELFVPDVQGTIITHSELNKQALMSDRVPNYSESGGRSKDQSHSKVLNFTPVFNISTPNPEAFKKSQRQILTEAGRTIRELSQRLD